MTDRIDPGPGWRLLEIGEIRPAGYQYLSPEGFWSDGSMVGVIVYTSGGVCRVRVYRKGTTKSIATQATVICATPDGVREERTISRKSGLTEYDCERIGRAWENAQASPAKYIMLEIQREGEP